jgi:hypothetical protein
LQSQEGQVWHTIQRGKTAVEKENLPALEQIVAENYQDHWGRDYHQLMHWFESYFQSYHNIKIYTSNQTITVHHNRATCEIKILLYTTFTITNEMIGDELYLTLFFEKHNKQWQISRTLPLNQARGIELVMNPVGLFEPNRH